MAGLASDSLFISVIIPTYNRRGYLERTLASIQEQSLSHSCYEVIIVDDGSSDDTREVTQKIYSYSVRYFYQDNQGDHVARNLGACRSNAQLLVFLDDDITLNRDYLRNLTIEYQAFEHTILLSVIQNISPNVNNPFAKLFDQVIPQSIVKPDAGFISFADCMSGILTVDRDDFFEIGMMQLLPGGRRNKWGGVDFGYRAYRMGYRFRRCAGAIAYHTDSSMCDLDSYCRNRENVSIAASILFDKYPVLEREIPMFYDKGPLNLLSDSSGRTFRKLFRKGSSNTLALWGMKTMVKLLEIQAPKSLLLILLYRWIISAHIYRGYQQGLRQL